MRTIAGCACAAARGVGEVLHARRGPIYGVWFLEELRRHHYELSPGTLYPLLHGLEDAGYLQREDRVVDGKVRKYYQITSEGEKALAEAREKIRELVTEMLEVDEPMDTPPLVAPRVEAAARR